MRGCELVALGPEDDPVVWVEINGRRTKMVVDSGAAYTCIQPQDATHLQRSGQFARTIGFEGIKQLIPTTVPVVLSYKNQKAKIPILVSEQTPIGLLGRDALCQMNCTIKCTADGCVIEVPKPQRQLYMTEAPVIYWLGNLSSDLMEPARVWEKFLMANLPAARRPDYPPHCTLQFLKNDACLTSEDWLTNQPDLLQLNSGCIVVGPEGAAMEIALNDFLTREYQDKDSVPHVTLLLAQDCDLVHISAMMKRAKEVVFQPLKENLAIWISEDRQFMKIMISAQGMGEPQIVRLTDEPMFSIQTERDFKEDMLQQVPECLWAQHSTDIGFVKSAQPVRVQLRPGARPPWKPQYPLKEEAVAGIEPQINGLLEAGVLTITQDPQSNTPLLPVRKPDNSFRLVHDLRAANEVIVSFPAEVPDPHVLLSAVPPDATHFTVIDLCGAFFSVPLCPESQGYFGFTFKNQSYQYTRLPMGYSHSPHHFNQVLKEDLAGLKSQLSSTVLQYVDDILLCAPDAETCHKDSVRLLQILAENGHKASQKKLQYCQDSVVYLGQVISHGKRNISDEHLTAIRQAPKPRTAREMLKFLGICGYSSVWVEEYTKLTEALRAMVRDTGSDNLSALLTWTPEGHLAFDTIKSRLSEAPALALPDYSKNFLLYVSTSEGGNHACGVLAQNTGVGTNSQPIAYYSVAYSGVEMGLAPCYRALVGVYLMYEKASALTMGFPVTILTHHSVRNLLNCSKYTLTASRIRDYYRMLELPDVTLVRCATVNPADWLPTSDDGSPHDCVREAEIYSKLRSDLHALPLKTPDVEYWTDGSCYRTGDGLSAGYAIVRACGSEFVTEKMEAIPQPCSAQLAELVALTEACLMAEGRRVTIYTDSAYAHNVCHFYGAIWKGRGFKKTDGSPIRHQEQIMKLLQAMMKPKEIAIAKCAAHKSDASRVSRGNHAADAAAKAVTGADGPGDVLLVTHHCDLEEKITLEDIALMQDEASTLDKDLWTSRGATKDERGLWRNHEGFLIAPPNLLTLLIQEAHGLAHVSRGEVKRKITKEFGFWAPYLLDRIDHVIGRCMICLKNNIRKAVPTMPGHIPTPQGPMSHLVIDYVDMIKRIEGKRYMLVVVDRFTRWVEACPTKRKDAQSVSKFLCREVIPRFGIPDRISSDNGKEFVDQTVRLVLQQLGIKQRLGCVYHPQSQGIVERMNLALKNRLVKVCQQTGLNWLNALPLALMACRTSGLRELRMTPHELLTGRTMPTPCLRTSGKGPSLSLLEDDLKTYVKYLTNIHRNICDYVTQKQARGEEEEDLIKRKENPVQPGDKVFVKVFRRKWYNSRREGPWTVVRSIGNAVQVEGSPTWFHLSHCIKAPNDELEDEEEEDEVEIISPQQEECEDPPEYIEDLVDDRNETNLQDEDTSRVPGDDGADHADPSAPIHANNHAMDNEHGRRFDSIDLRYAPNNPLGAPSDEDDEQSTQTPRPRESRKKTRPRWQDDYVT